MTRQEFIAKYQGFAKNVQKKTGIDYRFILAQAALESGWGKNAPGNMFFGVKATKNTPEHQKQLLTTTEVLSHPNAKFPQIISITKRSDGKFLYKVKDWFRKFSSPEESFMYQADFFSRLSRYAKAMAVKYDPYLFAEEIAKAGYATAPNYAYTLQLVMKQIDPTLPTPVKKK